MADAWPIGDLYRTQVVDLARSAGLYGRGGAPARALAAPNPGGADAESSPVPYDTIDRVLYTYLELRHRPSEIVDRLGDVAPDMIGRVVARVQEGEFGRRPAQVPKLSVRSIGHDVLLPRVRGARP